MTVLLGKKRVRLGYSPPWKGRDKLARVLFFLEWQRWCQN